MIVTDENIYSDIVANCKKSGKSMKVDIARDMMFNMRDVYESKLNTIQKENQILSAALRAVNREDEETEAPKEAEPKKADEKMLDELDIAIALTTDILGMLNRNK